MTEITQQAQIILNWLKDPTTKRYIKSILKDKKVLSDAAIAAMRDACSQASIQRSNDEIALFSRLNATEILLSNIPHELSTKEELTEDDVKELDNFFKELPN